MLKQEDWSNVFLISHHAQFDHFILSHHYDAHPKMSGCTLSMARLLLGNHISVSLDSVRNQFGLPTKTTPYNLFRGKHWHELTPEIRQQVADGACDEVESIWKLFGILSKQFPIEELQVVNTTVRMFTEPMLRGDLDLLAKIWKDENDRKATRLDALGITAKDLQSADKFAELLRAEGIEPETKPSPTGEGRIFAFAKTDDFMRDLLEHENEKVVALAEARLGQKSTLLQTRAETLGWMSRRGPLPVYLSYAGAGTLRVAGGDNCNWLNFKRRSQLRKAILAPEGFVLAPIDSSQIECRVLHWLAGGPDDPVLQDFRDGKDPYASLASSFYNERIYKPAADDPRKDEMEAMRGAGKQARLMCLGPDTLLLTDKGYKPIIQVSKADLLWDGIEWVAHQGLICQGEQSVVKLAGVQMTSDHPILCGTLGWLPAAACLRDESILSRASAHALASLPLRVTNSDQKEASNTSSCAVRAAPMNILSSHTICRQEEAPAAIDVQEKHLAIGIKPTTAMQMCARTWNIEDAYLEGLAQSTPAVTLVQNTMPLPITVGAAFKFGKLGKKTVELFWRIWSRCQDGMIRLYQSIASITKKDIAPAILGLPTRLLKPGTVVNFETSNKKSLTYDIACAGPRNRFTIASFVGPLIVHNCGYGAAGPKYRVTAKAGLYGPPIDLSLDEANRQVAIYREQTPTVCAKNTGYWAQCSRMLARLAGGDAVQWGPLLVKDHRIYLPSGQPLIYDTLEFHHPAPDEPCKEFERNGYWRVRTKRNGWKSMWGSKLTQHICEAVSRVIVSQAMNRITAMGYRVLNWPYDELLIPIPKDGKEEWHLERCKAEMVKEVPWLPGLPLDCEAVMAERYAK